MALEVFREPHLRHRLRAAPVPDGIDELLVVAGGTSAQRLERLADACGTVPDELLQAVRFFLREILLHPEADAYRVLAVEPDASGTAIKANYRRLQRWLHPDRQGDGPESVYSRRVNSAWAALRTPQARREYDQARAGQSEAGPSSAPGPGAPAPVYQQRWERVTEHGRWMARPQALVPLALLLLCGGLLLLAMREGPLPTLPEPEPRLQERVEMTPAPVAAPATEAPSVGGASPEVVRKAERKAAATVAFEPAPPVAGPRPVPAERSQVETPPVPPLQPDGPRPSTRDSRAISTAAALPATSASREPDRTVVPPRVPPSAAPHAVPNAVAPSQDPPMLEHARSARARGDELLGYLTRRRDDPPPPIWHGAAALDSAARIRAELAGGARFRRPRVDRDQAHWILAADQARMQVPVTAADRALGTRILHVGLRWKDGDWWIESVTLEEAS